MSNPKAFISHTQSDKSVARHLAEQLMAKGVDAWFAEWELQPGDSLIEKIFEEGLKDVAIFVVVLSKASVQSEWVRHELDVAMVQRIAGITRIVPAIVDECELPVSLRSLLWVDLRTDFETGLQRIVDVAHGRSSKPTLAAPPSRLTLVVPGMTREAAVVAALLAQSIGSEDPRADQFRAEQFEPLELRREQIDDAVDELESLNLVKVYRFLGSQPYRFGLVQPRYGLWLQLRGTDAIDFDPEEDVLALAAALVAGGAARGLRLAEVTTLPLKRVSNAAAYLDDYGLAEVHWYVGGPAGLSASPTAATRRFVRENAA